MSRLRDESGFTLTELLVAMTVGIVVLFGALGLLESTVNLSAKTIDRVEATAKARQAMDLVTRQLRSQVCVSADPADPKPALIEAKPDSMTFYASLTPESSTLTIQRRTLTYVAGASGAPGRITESVETGSGARPNPTFPTPPVTKVIAESVASAGTPIFRYYKLAAPGSLTEITTAPSLSLGERQRTVQVEVNFAVVGRKPSTRVAMSNTAYMRTPITTDKITSELIPACL